MLRRATALKRICDRQRVQNAFYWIFKGKSVLMIFDRYVNLKNFIYFEFIILS